MKTTVAFETTFALGGDADSYKLYGLSKMETGWSWATGRESALHLPIPESAPYGFFLELHLFPFVRDPEPAVQRITVRANGNVLGSSTIRWSQFAAFYCPPLGRDDYRLVVTIEHPDGRVPKALGANNDIRELSVAIADIRLLRLNEPLACSMVHRSARALESADRDEMIREIERLTDLPIVDFLTGFESIVGNCEFGFFQRQCGAEPLGLVRFASAYMQNMTLGIRSGFDGLAEDDDIQPMVGPKDAWFIREKRYQLVSHTFESVEKVTSEQMRHREGIKLKFLRRKLMEELSDERRIFVCRDSAGFSDTEVLSMFLAIRQKDDCNLLWVREADAGHAAGTVMEYFPGLLCGYIDRLAPRSDPADLSISGWLTICLNAWLLYQHKG